MERRHAGPPGFDETRGGLPALVGVVSPVLSFGFRILLHPKPRIIAKLVSNKFPQTGDDIALVCNPRPLHQTVMSALNARRQFWWAVKMTDPTQRCRDLFHVRALDRRIAALLEHHAPVITSCALCRADVYSRGGGAFVVNSDSTGLAPVTPSMLRTLVEKYVVCYTVRRTSQGDSIQCGRTMAAYTRSSRPSTWQAGLMSVMHS